MSTSVSHSNDEPNRAEVDPKISCPIVCGDYYRASGIFFATDAVTFLVTARHNVLPTEFTQTVPGRGSATLFSTEHTLPTLDLYLRNENKWKMIQTDIREAEEVRQTPEIDVLGVQVDFDPREYGYHVWTQDDIHNKVPTEEELEIIGFDGFSFPSGDREYDPETYRRQITLPRQLSISNPLSDSQPSVVPVEMVGVDWSYEGGYRGLSGSPVLDDGLIGIHAGDVGMGQAESVETGEYRRLVYTRAAVLPDLLED